jgi:hypothetical protein
MKAQLIGILMCFSASLYAQKTKAPTSVAVLFFDDSKKMKVYKNVKKSTFFCIANDTTRDDYFTIKILKKIGNLYQVSATSILHPQLKGYIKGENLGVNTRSRNSVVKLFSEPNYKAIIKTIEQNDGIMVRVIAIQAPWLKVTFELN